MFILINPTEVRVRLKRGGVDVLIRPGGRSRPLSFQELAVIGKYADAFGLIVHSVVSGRPPVGMCPVSDVYVDPRTKRLTVEYDDEEEAIE